MDHGATLNLEIALDLETLNLQGSGTSLIIGRTQSTG
jgi:hypothetical protein